METRFLFRLTTCPLSVPLRQLRHNSSNSKPSTRQANPIGDYYASLLESPTPAPSKTIPPSSKRPSNPSSTHPSAEITPSSDSPQVENSRPSILFSSRLSSPLERRSEIKRKSTLIAGIWVPPRPEEPDNCCMSGCVNCVWDRYGDELEEWAGARREADGALRRERGLEGGRKRRRSPGAEGRRLMTAGEGREEVAMAFSMDDDGGGSETNWNTDALAEGEDLFKGVPVGIREFMKQEKRLKEKHAREGSSGG